MVVRDAALVAEGQPQTVARLRAAVAASTAAKVVELATLVLLATLVPRLLGPADYGRFAVPLTVVTIGSLAMTLGGPTLMARFVPAAAPEQRVALARAIGARLAKGRGVQLAAIAVGAVVLVALDPAAFPPVEVALVVAALALNVATTLALQMTLGLGRAGPWSLRYPLQNVVLIVAVLVLYPMAGVTGSIVAVLVAAVASTAFAAVVAAPIVRAAGPRVAVPEGAIRFGVLQAGGAALVQLTQRGGVLAVALLAGSSVQTGYAALAVGIALGATYAILQAFTVSLPHLADGRAGRAVAERAPDPVTGPGDRTGPGAGAGAGNSVGRLDGGDTAGAEALLRRLAGGLLVVLVPGGLVVAVLLEPLVPVVFGEQYQDAVPTFGPALAAVVLAPLAALAVQASALRLRPQVALASGAAGAVAFLVASLAFVPRWEAIGGTAATFAGVATGAVVSVVLLRGAAGARVVTASFAGAALVGGVALLAP